MWQLDLPLLRWLNRIADASPALTRAITWVYWDPLKTALVAALLWWAWFDGDDGERRARARELVAAGLGGSVACVALVRLLAAVLPFRLRPLADPALGLHFPLTTNGWGEWSAFPSDNAVMFSMLSVCLFAVSRPLGVLAALDTVALICFPRVFLGIHHPTDVGGGLLIGGAAGWIITRVPVRRTLAFPAQALLRWRPQLFYASAFLVTYLLTEVFWPVTRAVVTVMKLARGL